MASAEEGAPAAEANGSVLSNSLCTYHRSQSREAEAYRGVRTALYFSTRGEGHKVIQITSPNMADGKTTLASNLAVSIAQSGKKIILIEADFRRPRVHKVFGLPSDVGLASVIAGDAELPDAIKESGVPNLSILVCGPRPANPAELLTSSRFQELLDVIRGQYDFVLIDTPPLLAVSDPCVVTPRVDGVLLIIRVSKNGRPDAERAREILNTLGAKVLGVVVNGVSGHPGAAGYGYERYIYRYGYGYRYGYTQGYGYTDDDYSDDGYYAPAEEEPALDVATPKPAEEALSDDESGAMDDAAMPAGHGGKRRSRRKSRHDQESPGLLARVFKWGKS
jgi:capsular exopolysaccharide synthesis family protein